jgi:hypothetical protein
MKITRQRRAISQSMDLFIIIAAVLGVGGVVTASVYNLVSSATSDSSISIINASLRAGASSASSPINCGSATSCEVVFAGTSTGSAAATCTSPCTITSGGGLTWGVGASAGVLIFDLSSTPAQLASGSQTSFVLSGTLTTTGSPVFWSPGTPVTINVLFGPASAQVTVVSQ